MIQGTWLMQGEDLSVPMEIRKKVFVEEQHVDPAHEQDAFDAQAMHVVMWDVNPKTDEKRPVGTGRIYYGDEGFMLGRICVLPEYRGQRVGDLMTRLMLWKASQFAEQITIHAQTAVKGFYARYGFRQTGETFMEEGIEHIRMQVKKAEITFPSECGEDCAKRMVEK